jgi:N-hydroxyarylamine O-acetyltransferase
VQLKLGLQNDLYRHQLIKGDALIDLYTFDDGHYQESDFTLGNYYTNTHPDSKFVKELIVSRVDQDLTEFINGRTYTIIEKGQRTDSEIKDQAEFQIYLMRFGIEENFDFTRVPKND